jgi:hypothetical protein
MPKSKLVEIRKLVNKWIQESIDCREFAPKAWTEESRDGAIEKALFLEKVSSQVLEIINDSSMK